jgi:hypothetical protein
MAREEGGAPAMAREEEVALDRRGQRRKREKGHDLVGRLGLLGQLGARWPMGQGKKKVEINFKFDF